MHCSFSRYLTRGASILGACLISTAVYADAKEVWVSLREAARPTVPMTELPSDAGYFCEAPTHPAEVQFSVELEPSFLLDAFWLTDKGQGSVVIRRAGSPELDPTGPSRHKKVSTARFSRSHISREKKLRKPTQS